MSGHESGACLLLVLQGLQPLLLELLIICGV